MRANNSETFSKWLPKRWRSLLHKFRSKRKYLLGVWLFLVVLPQLFLRTWRWIVPRYTGCRFWETLKPHPDMWRFGKDSKRHEYVNYCSRYDSPTKMDISEFTISVEELFGKRGQHAVISGVPKILHQMYKSRSEFPQLFGDFAKNCHESNPDWTHVIWTDDDFNPFVEKYYPEFYDIFVNFPHIIQKLDTIRYFILHHFGGIYLDADVECLDHNLDEWVQEFSQYDIAMEPIHIIFSPPGHPFWMKVLNETLLNPSHFNEAGKGVLDVAQDMFAPKVMIDRPQAFFREKYFNMLGVSTWRWKMMRQDHIYWLNDSIWLHFFVLIPLTTICFSAMYPFWGLQRIKGFKEMEIVQFDDSESDSLMDE